MEPRTALALKVFTVTTVGILLSPTSGRSGSTYTVTGSGFSLSSGATIEFNGVLQTPTGGASCSYSGSTITTTSSGGFGCTFAVPTLSGGGYTVLGTDPGGQTASASFTVSGPSLSVSPSQGPVGASYTVAAPGLSISSGATITFNSVLQTPTGKSGDGRASSAGARSRRPPREGSSARSRCRAGRRPPTPSWERTLRRARPPAR